MPGLNRAPNAYANYWRRFSPPTLDAHHAPAAKSRRVLSQFLGVGAPKNWFGCLDLAKRCEDVWYTWKSGRESGHLSCWEKADMDLYLRSHRVTWPHPFCTSDSGEPEGNRADAAQIFFHNEIMPIWHLRWWQVHSCSRKLALKNLCHWLPGRQSVFGLPFLSSCVYRGIGGLHLRWQRRPISGGSGRIL